MPRSTTRFGLTQVLARMGDIHSPRHYFLQVVIPAYEELGRILLDGVLGNRRDLVAAGRAAEACLHLADHIARDPVVGSQVPGAPKSKLYIQDLSKRYRYFAIAKDMANAFKHRKISDQERRLEGVESLVERWALIRFSDDEGHYWATRKVVIVRLNGGVEIFAEDVIERCIAAWSVELTRLNVIPSPPRIELAPKRFLTRDEVPERPRIEMLAQEGEYFESQPILLSYDAERDMFRPMQSKIGSVLVDVQMRVAPSRFALSSTGQESKFTLAARDTDKGTG